ncbi:MAG: hypothetical protein Q7R96_00055 [Nanoarchaeota archaeon]|nr:hypothetical protein [Nanoarchaeota archaeon]
MSSRIKRATFFCNPLAGALFPQPGSPTKGYLTILDELQTALQDKGDDPRYARVFFAAHEQDKFVEINSRNIELAEVFPRISAVRYEYGQDGQGLHAVLSTNVRDSLVVIHEPGTALLNRWIEQFRSLDYTLRIFDLAGFTDPKSRTKPI